MATCEIGVHGDMYGLGIRMGFYIQWFGIIVAYWLGESSVQDLRVLNALFVFAISLGLVIQTTMNNIHAVEIYIILLLAFGQFYFAIPLYLWRLITGCHPNWNLSRWPQAPSSPIFRFLTFILCVVLLGYQMWFWTTGIRELHTECQQYGFLFTKIPLDNSGFVAVNIMFNLALLLGAFWVLCVTIGLIKGTRRKRKRKAKKVEFEALQELQTLFDFTVAIINITAIELVVQWNRLTRSNNVATAAQLIPTVVSAGILIRIFFQWLVRQGEYGDGSEPSRPRSPPFVPFDYPPDPGGSVGTVGGNDRNIIVDEEVSEMAMSTAASSLREDDNDPGGPDLQPNPFPLQPPPPPPNEMPPGGRPPPPPMPAFVPGRMPGGMPPPPPPPGPGGGLGGGGRPPPPPI